jgi:hypothetical protein
VYAFCFVGIGSGASFDVTGRLIFVFETYVKYFVGKNYICKISSRAGDDDYQQV